MGWYLVKVIDSKNQEIYRILSESPGEVFLDAAVTGTGMISPKIFSEYYLPYTKKYSEILHKKGKLYLNHASGEPVLNILEMIKETDIDGLYGLSYPPTSDMKISAEVPPTDIPKMRPCTPQCDKKQSKISAGGLAVIVRETGKRVQADETTDDALKLREKIEKPS